MSSSIISALKELRISLNPFFDRLLLVYIKLHRLILQYGTAPSRESDTLLKAFLRCDHDTRQAFISRYAMPLFEGVHPKNIFNYRAEFFMEQARPEDVVIDIACGTGLNLYRMAPLISRGYGLELDRSNLQVCEKFHSAANISYLHADIFNLDYASLHQDTGYTTAIFSHILEHVANVPALLTKVAAERILVCVPSQENWLSQLKIHCGVPYLTDASHYREYTREMLMSELMVANYAVEFMGFNSEGEIICQASRLP